MTAGLSFYLDLLRLIASLMVFVGHSRHDVMPGMPPMLASFTGEGVAIFFVLSGFMMQFVVATKERAWRDYARARAARLYSVAPIALIATAIADAIGSRLNPQTYGYLSFYGGHGWFQIGACLTFLNELWTSHTVFGSNEAYWSLGFEVPYYLFFGLVAFARGRARWLGCLVWAIVVGPKIVLYLPLWLIGVGTYRLLQRERRLLPDVPARPLGMGLFIASIAGVLLLRATGGAWGIYHFQTVRDVAHSFVYFHLLGLLVATNIYGAHLLAVDRNAVRTRARAMIVWAAGGSFTLYLAHEPLLIAFGAVFPALKETIAGGLALMVATVAIVLLLAELGERRKRFYRRLLRWI